MFLYLRFSLYDLFTRTSMSKKIRISTIGFTQLLSCIYKNLEILTHKHLLFIFVVSLEGLSSLFQHSMKMHVRRTKSLKQLLRTAVFPAR